MVEQRGPILLWRMWTIVGRLNLNSAESINIFEKGYVMGHSSGFWEEASPRGPNHGSLLTLLLGGYSGSLLTGVG